MNLDPNSALFVGNAKKTSTKPPGKPSPFPSITVFIIAALVFFNVLQIIADPHAAVRIVNRLEHRGD